MRSKRARSEVFVLVLTVSGCLAPAAPAPPPAMLEQQRADRFRDHMRAGMEAHERGEYALAEVEFLSATKIERTLPEPRMAASFSAQRQFHYEHAENWLRGALVVAPWREDVRVLLTGVLL